jgi:RNA polymerase sigma-70 factor (ECF subfamily)
MPAPIIPAPRDADDDGFIENLLREHGSAIRGYALQLTNDRMAAEDITQEILLRAWRHRDRLLDGRGSVRGWLLTVARNLITDAARARSARPSEVGELSMVVPRQRDHADQVVASLTVRNVIAQLPPQQREVIQLIYLDELPVKRVSEILGIPTGTVKSRCHYGIHAMHDVLSRKPCRRRNT